MKVISKYIQTLKSSLVQLREMYYPMKGYLDSLISTSISRSGVSAKTVNYSVLTAYEDVLRLGRVVGNRYQGKVLAIQIEHLPPSDKSTSLLALHVLTEFGLVMTPSDATDGVIYINKYAIEEFWYAEHPHIQRVNDEPKDISTSLQGDLIWKGSGVEHRGKAKREDTLL